MNFKLDLVNTKNYELLKTTTISELDMTIYELSHNKTKAKILLYENDDENRVFNIAFKTPVDNSKGTPHILEHSVLCGSRKYNVKDPFIELAKSSMNTFLNAMTYPDKTCYPVASANLKDFKNLTDVYLDSVFFPNIYKNKNIFMQEGWHYEIEDDKLTVNGVVLNEMRGVYSDKNEILSDLVYKSLYKNTNYAYAYGGDPKEIINLSYEEFLAFHKKFYSPTNSIICFYGKLDFNERLSYLHNEYLSKFDFDEKNIVNFEDYFDINNLVTSTDGNLIHENGFYNVDVLPKEKESTILSYNFMLNRKKSTFDFILIRIIRYILFEQEGAIIKEELIKNKLGQSIQTSFDPDLYKQAFCIQSFNIDESKKDAFVKCIDDKIKDILNNGIEKEKFESGVNTVYYNCLDRNDAENKGLHYILESLISFLYGEDISICLEYKKAFEEIKKMNLDDLDGYIYSLIKEIFVDNKNKNLVSLSPKVNLLNEYNNDLKNTIEIRKESMTESQYNKTIEEAQNLKKYQETKDDDYSCLPKLLISDIERDKKLIDYNLINVLEKKVLVTNKKINDLIYFGLNIKLDQYTDFEIYMLAIMTKLLTKIDVIDCDYKKLNTYIDLYTGLFTNCFTSHDEQVYLRFEIKTIVNNLDDAFDLLYRVICSTLFEDKKRILEILNEIKTDSSSDIIGSGHLVVLNRALASISPAVKFMDMSATVGIAFNQFLQELIKNYNDNFNAFSTDLKYMAKKVFNKENFSYDVCLDEEYLDKFTSSLSKLIDRLNNTLDASSYKFNEFFDANSFKRQSNSEAILTNSDVNFVARVGKFKAENYNGSMLVLSTLFNYDYLWNNIRVLGGAYGCISKFYRTGTMGFATYRDPNIIKSDECFKSSVSYLEGLNDKSIDIEKLIVSTIAKIDNPLNARHFHERNLSYYLSNRDNDYMNKKRHEILDTTIDTLKDIDNQLVDIINTNETCALVAEKSIEEAKSYYSTVFKLNL